MKINSLGPDGLLSNNWRKIQLAIPKIIQWIPFNVIVLGPHPLRGDSYKSEFVEKKNCKRFQYQKKSVLQACYKINKKSNCSIK